MPLYEYQCQQCGHRFELIQKFSDAPITECEKCHGAVQKLLSASGLRFKGSGFYITDYAKKEKEPTPKKEEQKKEAATEKSPTASTTASPAPPATGTTTPPKPPAKS
jgi:putative FmdB family regulatory protein